jgi:hypothetical protein
MVDRWAHWLRNAPSLDNTTLTVRDPPLLLAQIALLAKRRDAVNHSSANTPRGERRNQSGPGANDPSHSPKMG